MVLILISIRHHNNSMSHNQPVFQSLYSKIPQSKLLQELEATTRNKHIRILSV